MIPRLMFYCFQLNRLLLFRNFHSLFSGINTPQSSVAISGYKLPARATPRYKLTSRLLRRRQQRIFVNIATIDDVNISKETKTSEFGHLSIRPRVNKLAASEDFAFWSPDHGRGLRPPPWASSEPFHARNGFPPNCNSSESGILQNTTQLPGAGAEKNSMRTADICLSLGGNSIHSIHDPYVH